MVSRILTGGPVTAGVRHGYQNMSQEVSPAEAFTTCRAKRPFNKEMGYLIHDYYNLLM